MFKEMLKFQFKGKEDKSVNQTPISTIANTTKNTIITNPIQTQNTQKTNSSQPIINTQIKNPTPIPSIPSTPIIPTQTQKTINTATQVINYSFNKKIKIILLFLYI